MKSSALQKSSLCESFFSDGLHGKKFKNIVYAFYMLKHTSYHLISQTIAAGTGHTVLLDKEGHVYPLAKESMVN